MFLSIIADSDHIFSLVSRLILRHSLAFFLSLLNTELSLEIVILIGTSTLASVERELPIEVKESVVEMGCSDS